MAHGIDFSVGFSRSAHPGPTRSRQTMDLLVIGDFGGSAERTLTPRRVTVENFDALLERIAPTWRTGVADDEIVTLSSFEDFHPDRIATQLPEIGTLLDLRRRLQNAATYREAADELLAGADTGPEPAAASADPTPTPAAQPGTSLFQNLIGEKATVSAKQPETRGARQQVNRIIRDLVAPHIERGFDDNQTQLLAIVDDSIAIVLRRTLHDPVLQRLEAAWRGLHWLVTSLDIDDTLQIHMIDAAYADIAADLAAPGGLPGDSVLYRRIIEDRLNTPGERPISMIVTDYCFGRNVDELDTLGHLGALAGAAGCPLVAAGAPQLFGCDSLPAQPRASDWNSVADEIAEPWHRLRRGEHSEYVGLAAPRLLLRLPYGAKGEPTELFEFEELTSRPNHEDFLWGNPAYGCAILSGLAFLEQDAAIAAGTYLRLDAMPLAIYDDGSGQAIMPAAETYLSEDSAGHIARSGLMSFLSQRNADSVALLRFQSIADPPVALRGM